MRRLIDPSLELALAEVRRYENDADALLSSLMPFRLRLSPFEKRFRHGVTLWSMASLLTKLRDDDGVAHQLLPSTIGISDPTLERLLRGNALDSAGTLFRAWVSLVYMRPEDVMQALKSIGNPGPHLQSFLALLAHDHVRQIRNAISHGTFVAEHRELVFNDRSRAGAISYVELDNLSSAFFAIWTCMWAVSMAPDVPDA